MGMINSSDLEIKVDKTKKKFYVSVKFDDRRNWKLGSFRVIIYPKKYIF